MQELKKKKRRNEQEKDRQRGIISAEPGRRQEGVIFGRCQFNYRQEGFGYACDIITAPPNS